jgi:transposase
MSELSREFGVTAQSITNCVGQAAIDNGKPLPAWFAGRSDATSTKSSDS